MIDAYEETYDSSSAWEELKGAWFEACSFRNVNWARVDLRQARFEDCTFTDCDLSNIKAFGASFQDVRFGGCKLLGIAFEARNPLGLNVRFERCNLEALTWQEMDVRGFQFQECKLQHTYFTAANCEGVKFATCDLLQAVFERTNLNKADFRTAEQWTIDPAVNQVKGSRFQKEELKGLLQQWGLDLRDD
jgi:uncharacterized protein YjbI with pentapeptide repeats